MEQIKKEIEKEVKLGCLSSEDIYEEILNNEIQIFPFRKEYLTGIGYNLTPSDFVFSTGKKILLEVEVTQDEKYVMIPPNDTVLVLSKEYVSVSKRIMGTFHSRVRKVSEGFGHISTTLDAGWHGSLLFAINNPSNKKKKFLLQSDSGNGMKDVSFATLIFQYLETELPEIKHDNRAFRTDVLSAYYNTSSYVKRTYNKSFKMLNDIIELTQRMSPERPTKDVFTEMNEELQEFLIEILNEYELSGDSEKLRKQLGRLDYGFEDAIHNASYIFSKQISGIREIMEQLDGEETTELIDELIEKIKILIGGCRVENKNIRWKYYIDTLEKDISKYRISKRMRFALFLQRNWSSSLLCMLLAFGASGLIFLLLNSNNTETETWRQIVTSLIPVMVGAIITFILNHSKDSKN